MFAPQPIGSRTPCGTRIRAFSEKNNRTGELSDFGQRTIGVHLMRVTSLHRRRPCDDFADLLADLSRQLLRMPLRESYRPKGVPHWDLLAEPPAIREQEIDLAVLDLRLGFINVAPQPVGKLGVLRIGQLK